MDNLEKAKRYIAKQKLLGMDNIVIRINQDNSIEVIRYRNSAPDKQTGFLEIEIPDFVTCIREELFKDFKQNIKLVYRGNSIDDTSKLFSGYKGKRIDLSEFNMTLVCNMKEMFKGSENLVDINFGHNCNALNTDMSHMFEDCMYLRKIDMSSFNTSSVTNMAFMFDGCRSLKELGISNFNTQRVTNMENMFAWCVSMKEIDLSSFNTGRVKNMEYMFRGCGVLKGVCTSNFDISSVENILGMFYGCSLSKCVSLNTIVFWE